MKVKVFQPNYHGKIEFTRAELEKLLNEVYSDGYKEGKYDAQQSWTWTSPYLTTTPYNGPYVACYDTAAANENCVNAADVSMSTTDCIKPTNTIKVDDTTINATKAEVEPLAYTIKLTNSDANAISKAVDEIIIKACDSFYNHNKHSADRAPLDAFDTLAKELGL